MWNLVHIHPSGAYTGHEYTYSQTIKCEQLYMYFCVCKARMIDTVAGLSHPTFDV